MEPRGRGGPGPGRSQYADSNPLPARFVDPRPFQALIDTKKNPFWRHSPGHFETPITSLSLSEAGEWFAGGVPLQRNDR